MIVNSARDSFNFDADPDSGDQDPGSALENIDAYPGHEHFFKIYWIFFHKAELSTYFSSFFMLKLDKPFRDEEIFDNHFF